MHNKLTTGAEDWMHFGCKYERKSLDKVRIVNQYTHFKPENIFFVKIEWGILGVPRGPFNNYVDKMRGGG